MTTSVSEKLTPGILRDPGHLLSLGFGTGLAKKAPGTVGTLIGIPFFLLLAPLSLWQYICICLVFFVLGIYLCERTANFLGVHDHPGIVWDEVVGYMITMIAIPTSFFWVVIGFVLFRFFDIIKPWPINWIDRRVSGGFGIMLDDVIAALYALLIIQLLYQYL